MTLLTIGELARRSGVPVRTIRFWSDEGVLPETDRSRSNYRRYDARAVARLDLVRTLRELGLGLDDVRLVLDHRRTVEDVAASHVQALALRWYLRARESGPPCARVGASVRASRGLRARESGSPRAVAVPCAST